MAQRKFSRATIIALALTGLTLTLTTLGAVTVSTNVASQGSIATSAGIGVFSDATCTIPLTSIDWGSATPGGTVTRTVYVKNTGAGVTLTLSMATSNWSPANANGPLAITWNREGTTLTPGQSTAAAITLTATSSITGITTFSVQISISGTG